MQTIEKFLKIFCAIFLFQSLSLADVKHEFDVLHYEIYIDLYNGLVQRNGFYRGYVLIKLATNQSLNEINIHAVSGIIQVDSILVQNQKLIFQQNQDNLKVFLPRIFSASETLNVLIYFKRESNLDRGFYFYRKDEVVPNLPSDIAYTMTEPSDSRYWFPCYDEPWDKATVDVIVKVRKNFLVASNGLLIRDEVLGDERTFHWRSLFPMSTYLITFATSEYITFSHWYRRISNPDDSIEVKYYVWREDSAKAGNAFKNVVDMMKFFSEKFGEYPFEKYGMVAVYPFGYGGMEHQTMTTIHRRWLDGNYEGGIAHELAHQWWGDLVTCENWSEIWLNEGFASYGDALYTEYKYGVENFKAKLQSWAIYYFFEDSIIRYSIYNPPPQKLFGTAVYFKGAWVLHMLRNLIGDSLFFSVLKEWGKRYAYSTGTTQKFIQVVNDITGEDFNWFFEQWVYNSGYPVFDYNVWVSNDDSLSLIFQVRQIQKNSRVFKVPIEIKIQAGDLDTLLTFWNYTIDTVYSVKFKILNAIGGVKVQFDPENKILKKVESAVSNAGEIYLSMPYSFKLYQNYPNPFNTSTEITFEIWGSGVWDCEVNVYDVLGRKIREIFSGKVEAGRYRVNFVADGLPSGVYFYELVISGDAKKFYRDIRKMVLIK
jgi:aminopeptidase N